MIAPLLQLMQVPGVGHTTLNRLLDRLSSLEMRLHDLNDCAKDDLVFQLGLKEEWADVFVASRDRAEELAIELDRRNIQIVLRDNCLYPKRLQSVLGDAAPPALFVRGNAHLLQKQAVAIVGVRECSERGIKAARACIGSLVKYNINIVSGNAAGIDETAHRSALENNGSTTFVLPYGILNVHIRPSIIDNLHSENHLFLSEFPPHQPWATPAAMQRNRTICALSGAVLIVESGSSGGSFSTGENALKCKTPLYVVNYDPPNPQAPGNGYFLQRGARGLSERQPSITELRETLNRVPIDRERLSPRLFPKA